MKRRIKKGVGAWAQSAMAHRLPACASCCRQPIPKLKTIFVTFEWLGNYNNLNGESHPLPRWKYNFNNGSVKIYKKMFSGAGQNIIFLKEQTNTLIPH